VVLVVVREDPEAAVAAGLEEALGGEVVAADLKAHIGAFLVPGGGLRRRDQGAANAPAPRRGGHRDRVDPRHRGRPAVEQQHVAEQVPGVLRDQGIGPRLGQHVAELAAGQTIAGEAGVLECKQGIEVGDPRGADAGLAPWRAVAEGSRAG
jgi:hypothetical protein